MKAKQRHSGQSLVEFALLLPVFIFLILGFFDLGRAVFYYSSLTNAVREATRRGVVIDYSGYDNDPSAIQNELKDKVLEFAFGFPQDPQITVTVNEEDNYYSTVQIEATYTFKPITPGIKQLFGTSEGIELLVQSEMHLSPGSW